MYFTQVQRDMAYEILARVNEPLIQKSLAEQYFAFLESLVEKEFLNKAADQYRVEEFNNKLPDLTKTFWKEKNLPAIVYDAVSRFRTTLFISGKADRISAEHNKHVIEFNDGVSHFRTFVPTEETLMELWKKEYGEKMPEEIYRVNEP